MSDSKLANWLFPLGAETRGILVRASVSYLADQSEPENDRWVWSYHIRIENHSDQTVQLLTRHWDITDARGGLHVVDGDGVVGDQPVLNPGQDYDYVSGCPLTTQSGVMEGYYGFIGEDGAQFEVEVPRLDLRAPVTA